MLRTEDALHPPGPNSGSWSIFGEQNTDQTAGRGRIRLSARDQAQKPISRSLCLSPNSPHFLCGPPLRFTLSKWANTYARLIN